MVGCRCKRTVHSPPPSPLSLTYRQRVCRVDGRLEAGDARASELAPRSGHGEGVGLVRGPRVAGSDERHGVGQARGLRGRRSGGRTHMAARRHRLTHGRGALDKSTEGGVVKGRGRTGHRRHALAESRLASRPHGSDDTTCTRIAEADDWVTVYFWRCVYTGPGRVRTLPI